MRIDGQITVEAPRTRVFDAVRDARFFSTCIDGVKDLVEIDATHYKAVLETKVAYIQFSFDVEVEMVRVEAPRFLEVRTIGKPAGVVGRLTSTATTELRENGEETIIDYVIDVTLTGKLGSIGQPVLKSKAREMEREFTKRLRAAFAEQAAAKENVSQLASGQAVAAHRSDAGGFFRRLRDAFAALVARLRDTSTKRDVEKGAQ